MLIVKIEAINNQHYFECQSNRDRCWLDGYIEVPKPLEIKLISSKGYCDLVIENGELRDVISREELIPNDETEILKNN